MTRDNILKRAGAVFIAAILIYIAAFYGIESLRGRHGPWQVIFMTGASGEPSVVISEPKLGITNVTCVFPDQRISLTNFTRTVVFNQPITNVPFGRVVYLDTTFLPGTVVFDLFGHEVQLLPRTLILDREETPWQSGTQIDLPGR